MIGNGLLTRRAECARFQSNAVKSQEILSSILLHEKLSTLKSRDGVRKGRLRFVLPRGARRDPYSVLQIPKDSDLKTVKQAYRRLIRTVHPDVNKQSTAAQKTMEIILAYSTLCEGTVRTHAT
jgi:DnaJ-domain-containing protein 1